MSRLIAHLSYSVLSVCSQPYNPPPAPPTQWLFAPWLASSVSAAPGHNITIYQRYWQYVVVTTSQQWIAVQSNICYLIPFDPALLTADLISQILFCLTVMRFDWNFKTCSKSLVSPDVLNKSDCPLSCCLKGRPSYLHIVVGISSASSAAFHRSGSWLAALLSHNSASLVLQHSLLIAYCEMACRCMFLASTFSMWNIECEMLFVCSDGDFTALLTQCVHVCVFK